MTNLINCTAHNIVLFIKENEKITIKPSGYRSRITYDQYFEDNIEVNDVDIPIYINSYNHHSGLPPPEKDTLCIVSMMAACELANIRDDLIVPNTAPTACIRDEYGNIKGVSSFLKITGR